MLKRKHQSQRNCRRFVPRRVTTHLIAIALVVVAFGTDVQTSAAKEADIVTVTPFAQRVARGSVSGQGIATVRRRDQAGDQDDWASYLEFYPAARGHSSVFTFALPRERKILDAESMILKINYRGAKSGEQRWRWHIRNHRTKRWVAVGLNNQVSDWRWSFIRFDVSGDFNDYVNDNGRFHILYSTPSDHDASNIDYLSMEIKFGETPNPGNVWRPTPGTSWQWQLTGAIDTSFDVEMYDIDLFDTPKSVIDSLHRQGRIVICYFSAGSFEDWRSDAGRFPDSVKGNENGWEGERWLDIRALDALAPIMAARLDIAVAKGCDGVEPDNVDGYTNATGFALRANDQFNYNVWLANQAHARGLSIGLKNNLDQARSLEPYFDWALNERCYEFNECEMLMPFISAGKAVFGVEYSGNPNDFCPRVNALNFDWLIKNWDLDAPRQACR